MKTDTIEIFEKEYLISERTAQDVLELIEFIQKNQESMAQDFGVHVFAAAQSLSSALKININRLPKWRIVARWRMNRKFSPLNLIKALTPAQLYQYQEKIFDLEGTGGKKKATAGSRSVDQLPQA